MTFQESYILNFLLFLKSHTNHGTTRLHGQQTEQSEQTTRSDRDEQLVVSKSRFIGAREPGKVETIETVERYARQTKPHHHDHHL